MEPHYKDVYQNSSSPRRTLQRLQWLLNTLDMPVRTDTKLQVQVHCFISTPPTNSYLAFEINNVILKGKSLQEKKLVFQEPVFIHLAAVKWPQEEVCAWPPLPPKAGYEAPRGTDPTRWASWRLQGAGMILSLNLVPRTHRDLPGRYTSEGRQVALPVPSPLQRLFCLESTSWA